MNLAVPRLYLTLHWESSMKQLMANLMYDFKAATRYSALAMRLRNRVTLNGRQMGEAGVLRLVRELEVHDSEKLIPALVERIRELRESNLQQDDATFMLGQATGGGPSLKNNLLAPLRFMGRITDRTEIE